MRILERNAVIALNVVKKKFTAFYRTSYKSSPRNSPHFLQKFTAITTFWTRVRKFLFGGNTENAVKIKNSPRFTAKRCKKYAVKITRFHHISPHFLREFTAKPRLGIYWFHIFSKFLLFFPCISSSDRLFSLIQKIRFKRSAKKRLILFEWLLMDLKNSDV